MTETKPLVRTPNNIADLVAQFYKNEGVVGQGGMATVYKLVFDSSLHPLTKDIEAATPVPRSDNENDDTSIYSDETGKSRNPKDSTGTYERFKLAAANAGDNDLVWMLDHKTLAVKKISQMLASDESFMKRFNREMEVLENFSHPNIVKVYGSSKMEDNLPCMIMDYIDDRVNLDAVAKSDKRISHSKVAHVGIEVLKALAYCHKNNIIHRDVKLGNIGVERKTGKVKILDFGIAKDLAPGSEQLTLAGYILGSPEIYAPELFEGLPGPSVDVFGIGTSMYKLLAGHSPIEKMILTETKQDTIKSNAVIDPRLLRMYQLLQNKEQFYDIRNYDSAVSDGFADCIMLMIAPDHSQRLTVMEAGMELTDLKADKMLSKVDSAQLVEYIRGFRDTVMSNGDPRIVGDYYKRIGNALPKSEFNERVENFNRAKDSYVHSEQWSAKAGLVAKKIDYESK